MSAKGLKYDSNKAMISLICRPTLEGMAAALMYGMRKYTVVNPDGTTTSGRDNYKKGLQYTRVADSAIRHVLAFLDGEDLDSESGLPHLDHALAALNMLKYQTVYNLDMDDRYSTAVANEKAVLEASADANQLLPQDLEELAAKYSAHEMDTACPLLWSAQPLRKSHK